MTKIAKAISLALLMPFLPLATPSHAATNPVATTCQFEQTDPYRSLTSAAIDYVKALSDGHPLTAAGLFSSKASLHVGDQELPVGEWLAEANDRTTPFETYAVIGVMFDGSNVVVLQLLEEGNTDGVTAIWIFEGGSSCLTDVHEF